LAPVRKAGSGMPDQVRHDEGLGGDDVSYRPAGRLTVTRVAVLAIWSIVVMFVTGIVLFYFTFGDCFDVQACKANTNRNFALIAGSGFVIYWAVFIALVRRWSRK
jgi:hypothetical protein